MKNKLNLSLLIVAITLCLTLAMSAFAQDSTFDSQSPEAPAASLFVDNFTYSGALTNNGWAAHSGAGTSALSTTTGLTFAGYPGSGTGNAVLVGNAGGEDDSMLLSAPQTANGTVYYSLLVNVNDAATDKTGDYFFHIGTRASTTSFVSFAARLFARIVGGNVNFGISNGSATPVYGTTNFSRNTTYLVIVKYTLNTSGNDPVSLWVIPAASGVPTTEAAAGTPEATETTTTGQDVIDALAIRQGSNATSTQEVVDGIRVGTTWADITGAAAPTAGGAKVFTTVMNGANEVPANSSPARGFGRVVLNAAETQITASFYWEGIGPGTTSGHIHGPAAVGVNAPVLFNLNPVTGTSGSAVDQVFAVSATDVANLRAGLYYMNIHSSVNFPGGEIRGQLRAISARADYDGDGKSDYGVVRPGAAANPNQLSWFIKLNGGGEIRRE
ncbi:MAG TPA: CHRD domain-containing protein, partial [Pyrinomonadaceae bacterium]|nr:CHRD domain-containing protein [Pyrinomonadaceae bacterium]